MEMSFSGSFEVGIPREETFALLSDPTKLLPVLPTFHSMEPKQGAKKTSIVKVKVGIGRIQGLATTEMTLVEESAPDKAGYEGNGSVMGSAYRMNLGFTLEESRSGGTVIHWQGRTEIFGKILAIAGGGLRSYAEKEINSIIQSLQEALVSVEHFEALSKRASSAPKKQRKAFSKFSRIFQLLFQQNSGADANGTAISDTTAKRILKPDPLRQLNDIPSSIEIDGDAAKPWVGQHLRRKEDLRLVRGLGLFVDDYRAPGMLHMSFVRSPYAHANIKAIDVSAAQALPGVRRVMTGKEIAELTTPFMQIGAEPGSLVQDYGIAIDRVLYAGEPVVMVIADSMRLVEDAIELVEVDYEPLAVITKSEDAIDNETLLHPQVGSNVIFKGTWKHGEVEDAFQRAAHIVKINRLHFHRFSSTPIETAAAVATWSPRGELDMLSNNGLPGVTAQLLAGYLGISTEQIRMRTHDVGGNFGTKAVIHPFLGLTALASKVTGGTTVKWHETRSDNLTSFQGSERTFLETEVALDSNGVITAVRSRHLDDCGAFTRYEPLGCAVWAQVYPATYKVRNLQIDFTQVVSNKTPATPNRGYSRYQHLWFMERVIDICAHQLDIPADEMRMRNYLQPEQFPYTTPNGNIYDSGDYPQMLEKAKQLIDYDGWKAKQASARAEGRLLGIGIGTTLDSGTNNFGQLVLVNPDSMFSGNNEGARIKIGLDGSVVVTLASSPQGQGHETTAAQVVADELNIGPDQVNVRTGFNSDWNSYGGLSGTIASQFVVTGLSAVHGAAQQLKAQLRKLAAFALQAEEDELEFGMGEMGPQLSVQGEPTRAINYWMLSNLANCNISAVPEPLRDINLNVHYIYKPPFEKLDAQKRTGNQTLTYAAQLHIAVVEVESATLQTRILDYAVVDDCGVAINPKIVEGQVHGATCHGIAAALQEALQLDDAGNLITATFTDYAPFTSLNMPDLRCTSIETPSPFSYNGAKGCGEGGGAPLHTLSAAIQDALYEKGVIITDSHNSPTILMEALNNPGKDSMVSAESR